MNSKVTRPVKELRGFRRISLSPGEAQTVKLSVPATKLAYCDVDRRAFVVEPGEYEVMVGSSSADIRQTTTVRVNPLR